MRIRRIFAIAGRWLVGLGVVVYLLRTLDLGTVASTVSTARIGWLLAGFALVLLTRLLGSVQLLVALRNTGVPLGLSDAFLVNAIAAFYSLFLPGQLTAGAVKWYKLTKASGQGPEVFATILLVRIVTSVIVLLFGVTAAFVDQSLGLRTVSWIGMVMALVLVLMLLAASSNRIVAWLGRTGTIERRPTTAWIRRRLLDISRAMRRSRRLPLSSAVVLVGIPIVTQFVSASMFFAVAHSLSLRIPFVSLVWLVSLVYFIAMIPATVSGLGLREGALMVLLPQYGIARGDALAFSLLLFSYSLLFGLMGGAVEAWDTLVRPLTRKSDQATDEKGAVED